MYKNMQSEIENLTRRVAEQAGNRCEARLWMTHPGVGLVTALATEVFLGDPQRYVGIIPREYSSGEDQARRSDQTGHPLLRFL
jgi:transposase